jgi:hypothetical protein
MNRGALFERSVAVRKNYVLPNLAGWLSLPVQKAGFANFKRRNSQPIWGRSQGPGMRHMLAGKPDIACES